MRLPKPPNPDAPKDLTQPRDFAETYQLREITSDWHAEANAHRPCVGIFNDPSACDARTIAIDFDGLVQPAFECYLPQSIDDIRPNQDYVAFPKEFKNVTIYVARILTTDNTPEDQTVYFESQLSSHPNDASDLQPILASELASVCPEI